MYEVGKSKGRIAERTTACLEKSRSWLRLDERLYTYLPSQLNKERPLFGALLHNRLREVLRPIFLAPTKSLIDRQSREAGKLDRPKLSLGSAIPRVVLQLSDQQP